MNFLDIPSRRKKARRFTPWLELRADRLIMSYKLPLLGGVYAQGTGDGHASASTGRHSLTYWRRDIRVRPVVRPAPLSGDVVTRSSRQ